MREQMQVPFDSRGETSDQDKGNAPKGLNRPAMPQGLEKPKPLEKRHLWMRRRCSCGRWTCGSPGHGNDGGSWYWQYFDAEGNRLDAGEHGLPLRGWGEGEIRDEGWNGALADPERTRYWDAYGDKICDTP